MSRRGSAAAWASGVGAASAAVLSLGRWYRSFDWEGEPDERLTAETADGWRLALARYRPQGESRPQSRPPAKCSRWCATGWWSGQGEKALVRGRGLTHGDP